MRKVTFRFLFVSSFMSLCFAFGVTSAFGQCGLPGTPPCPTTNNKTPKKITPKKTTPKPVVVKPKPQSKTTTTKTKPVAVTRQNPQPKPVNSAPDIEMVKIPAGSFMMGSDNGESDEKPVHRVNISNSFYMGKYEVTRAQWKAVTGNNPSYFKGDDLPVEQVSWDDVKDFIRKLNNLQSDYEYRLPTEAEWEYACRAGTTGDYAGNLDSMAWYGANSGNKTHSVGQKQPNAFGLYDMHGNVWEWTEDWYGSYSSGTVTDPTGGLSGSRRVGRGGGWFSSAVDLRSAVRGGDAPSDRLNNLGFRLARN